jgi:hypothetical protein
MVVRTAVIVVSVIGAQWISAEEQSAAQMLRKV